VPGQPASAVAAPASTPAPSSPVTGSTVSSSPLRSALSAVLKAQEPAIPAPAPAPADALVSVFDRLLHGAAVAGDAPPRPGGPPRPAAAATPVPAPTSLLQQLNRL